MLFIDARTRRQIAFVLYSTVVNFCLFAIFVAFADEIIKNIVQTDYAKWNSIFTLILIATSGCTRIFGAIIYSIFGESQTQNKIFYYSTLILSLTSCISACLPHLTYLGIVAPLILILIRITNGMVLGAVIPKAIVFNYTKALPNKRVLATCLIHIAQGLGFMTAIIFSITFDDLFGKHGWRVGTFACGILGIALSYKLRQAFQSDNINSTENNKQIDQAGYAPLLLVLAKYKFTMFRLICFASFISSGLAVFFYVMPNFLLQDSGYQAKSYRTACLFLIVGFLCGMFLSIQLDEKLGKKFYLISGILFKSWLVYVFGSFAKSSLVHITLLCSICMFIFGIYFAKLPVMIVSSFPKQIRYIGVAIVYNISFGIMFSISPVIIQWLSLLTHSHAMPTAYVIFFSYVSIISLWFMPKKIFTIHTHSEHLPTDVDKLKTF